MTISSTAAKSPGLSYLSLMRRPWKAMASIYLRFMIFIGLGPMSSCSVWKPVTCLTTILAEFQASLMVW